MRMELGLDSVWFLVTKYTSPWVWLQRQYSTKSVSPAENRMILQRHGKIAKTIRTKRNQQYLVYITRKWRLYETRWSEESLLRFATEVSIVPFWWCFIRSLGVTILSTIMASGICTRHKIPSLKYECPATSQSNKNLTGYDQKLEVSSTYKQRAVIQSFLRRQHAGPAL